MDVSRRSFLLGSLIAPVLPVLAKATDPEPKKYRIGIGFRILRSRVENGVRIIERAELVDLGLTTKEVFGFPEEPRQISHNGRIECYVLRFGVPDEQGHAFIKGAFRESSVVPLTDNNRSDRVIGLGAAREDDFGLRVWAWLDEFRGTKADCIAHGMNR